MSTSERGRGAADTGAGWSSSAPTASSAATPTCSPPPWPGSPGWLHRVIWVNPLKSGPTYEPTTRGMRAALPHIDLLVSGHNLASLAGLGAVLEALD